MRFRTSLIFIFFIAIESPGLKAQNASILGKITNDLGIPIEKVNVLVAGSQNGTSTDEQGAFQLKVEPNKKLLILFSHVGYVKDSVEIELGNDEIRELNRTLQETDILLNQVEIEGNKIGERKNVSAFHLDPVNSREVVSPFNDFSSVLVTLPGVVSNSELSSSYSVRGGNFDENVVLVNGIPIYRPVLVRSGQQEGLSFVNPDLVEDIRFYAGGWGSQYGDKMSSVLDIRYKDPKKPAGSAELSLLGGNAHLEGLINSKVNYAVGVRYKNSKYLLNTLEVDGEYLPNFTDFQGLVNYRINTSGKMGLLFSYAENNYQVIPSSQQVDFGTFELPLRLFVAFDGQEKLKYRTLQSGIFFEKQWKNILNKTILSGFYSYEREYYDVEGYYRLCVVQNDITQENFDKCLINRGIGSNYRSGRNFFDMASTTLENKTEIDINSINQVSFGIGYSFQFFEDNTNEFILNDSAGFVTVTDQVYGDNNLKVNQVFAYAQHDFHISPVTDLTYGLRIHFHDITDQFLLDPRLQFSWKPSSGRNIVYHLATGIYHQPPFFREYKRKDGTINKNVKAQSSMHAIAGFDYELVFWGRPFKLTGEVFYKRLWNVNPYDIDNVKIRYFGDNLANAYAAGMDFRISGEFIAGDQSWFSLGLLRTREDLKNDEPGYVPRPTDQLVNVAIFFQDHVPNLPTYKVHLTLFYNTPLPFYPPQSDRTTYFRGEKYQRVDIGFSKDFIFKHDNRLIFGLEILNLTNNANVISYSWIQDVSGNYFAVPNALSARYLNARLRFEW